MEPAALLATWAAGLAGGAVLVFRWGIGGVGYAWLALGASLLFAAPSAAAGGGAAAWAGVGLLVVGLVGVRRPLLRAGAAGLAGAALVVAALGSGEAPWSVITGAVLLGGVTSEMMLGHWYLVDPSLPRRSLRTLALVGLVGAAADFGVLLVAGASLAGEGFIGPGWAALSATTALLMAGVWLALGERGYPAVMAATGLSYLAVLTGAEAVVAGRLTLGA